MTEFKASNDLIVTVHDGDIIDICHTSGKNRLSDRDHLFSSQVQALREFFAQERCDELPFRHGDYWVFPQSDTRGGDRRVAVLVPGEGLVVYREDRLPGYVEGLQAYGYLAAAKAYFAAHPKSEPKKPWLDAQTGEVWSISDGDEGGLAICQREPAGDVRDDHPYFYGPNFDGVPGDALTAGTRLEVQS